MSRISTVFVALAARGRKALIPFITAGDPYPDLTLPLMRALVAGGADIIELGVPFSDPMADGPTIQRASERALAHGMSLRRVLALVSEFRKENATMPVLAGSTMDILYDSSSGVVAITQSTEVGTVYTPDEVRALAEFAHARGMYLHMDGARISNAAAALGVPFRAIGAASPGEGMKELPGQRAI